MKHLLSCLTACALLLFGALPCQAMPAFTPPRQITSMEELLEWYSALSGNALQECIVTKPLICTGDVTLDATPCRVDITFVGGLHIPAGARLTIDNPNLVLMGPPPVITVKAGGVLHIRRLNMLTAQAMPQGGIVVEAGGTLLPDAGIILPEGVVTDQNPPPNTLPPPTSEAPAPELPPPEMPDETPPPVTPPAEETLPIKGEVLKVTADKVLFALVTLPRVDPALTETIVIERSADAQVWSTEYIFRWNEDALGFTSEKHPLFGSIVSRTRSDGSKTDFEYLARLSGAPFYLRIVLTQTDGGKIVSDAIQLTEPPVGQYPGSEDYEDSDGNRGGGGQGSTDREEQKETAASKPEEVAEGLAQTRTQTSAGTASAAEPPISTTTPQSELPATQMDAEEQTAIDTEEVTLPTQANPSALSGQATPEQSKSLGSSARNWLVIAATLTLCGAIWIFTTKRKKS